MNMQSHDNRLIRSVAGRCRGCFVCVRECPAKAICVRNGKTEVRQNLCIGCGTCIRVCVRNAKQLAIEEPRFDMLFCSSQSVAAVLDPSFPAEFVDFGCDALIEMLRRLGFAYVCEGAVGADQTIRNYAQFLAENSDGSYISSTCPAVVSYVERHHPNLVDRLIPVISPMVATARLVRSTYGKATAVVYIGPCFAKKVDGVIGDDGEVNAVLTFVELRRLFDQRNIRPSAPSSSAGFDLSSTGDGRLCCFPGSLLQTTEFKKVLSRSDGVSVAGRKHFPKALEALDQGKLNVRFVEALCCDGCIEGEGRSSVNGSRLQCRTIVNDYVTERLEIAPKAHSSDMVEFEREFTPKNEFRSATKTEEIPDVLREMGRLTSEDALNCGNCGYDTCSEHAEAILNDHSEMEMCTPYTIAALRRAVKKEFVQLMTHELKSPLHAIEGYVDAIQSKEDGPISDAYLFMVERIGVRVEGMRRLIANLLELGRVDHRPTADNARRELLDLTQMAEHALENYRIQASPLNVSLRCLCTHPILLSATREDIETLFNNLIGNAIKYNRLNGTVIVDISKDDSEVSLTVSDTGIGMTDEDQARLFKEFCRIKTVKTRHIEGTGLGLSIIARIVRLYDGTIAVKSVPDEGSAFTISFPLLSVTNTRRSKNEQETNRVAGG